MLCLFAGHPLRPVVTVQAAIEAAVAPLETSANEKAVTQGRVTLSPVDSRTVMATAPQQVYLDPGLQWDDGSPIGLGDFPASMQFGNGISAMVWRDVNPVTLQVRTLRFTAVVFPGAADVVVRAKLDILRAILAAPPP